MNPAFVKISFRFFSPVLEHDTVETLWAVPVDVEKGLYRIDNIPVYFPGLAYDDVVFAEYDVTEGMLAWRKTVSLSGNSTIQVVMLDLSQAQEEVIKEIFEKMGCKQESNIPGYFVINVPEDLDYIPVKRMLEKFMSTGVLDYAEASLSANHQYS